MNKPLHLFLAAALATSSWAAESTAPAPASDVVVARIDKSLPSNEEQKKAFLWDEFANRPEEVKFASHPATSWKIDYPTFSAELVRKAAEAKLDADSLKAILGKMILKGSNDKLACLPVGAYATTLDGAPIWIVVVKWEFVHPGAGMGHVRMIAYDQKTLKQVGFNTCM